MLKRFSVCLIVLIALASSANASALFYSDLSSFNAAVAAAGRSTQVIDFESVASGDYSTASGLAIGGLSFVGPSSFTSPPYTLHVFSESAWGQNFAAGTGNTLAGVGEIDIALPPDTYVFGANVGESAVWAAGVSSQVELRLSTGEDSSTPVSPSRLFPFFGFVSDVPISSVDIGFGASFITIDNVTTNVPATVPEPAARLLLIGAVVIVKVLGRPSSHPVKS